MEIIILAGGLGNRLKPVTKDIPKPMVDIAGKPFLFYMLNYLMNFNPKRFILSLGYRHEIITNYFGDNFYNIQISYSVEKMPLGTGGAVKLALGLAEDESVIVINGDTFFQIDLNYLIGQSEKSKMQFAIALKYLENFNRYGLITFDKQYKLTGFIEKTTQLSSGFINGGIYIIRKDFFETKTNRFKFDTESNFSFEEFIVATYREENYFGIPFDNYFIDIGIPDDYLKAVKEIPAICQLK